MPEQKINPMPEQDKLVIATVKKIMPYGAFCTLDEFGGREAFLHVSEVASRWVKNIHEFLKEGQRVVARVHRVTPEKDQVDLSLRRVTESDKKLKMEDYRREKRSQKLIELCAKKAKSDATETGKVIAELVKAHGDIYSALEAISFNGESAFSGMLLSAEWKKILTEVAEANVHKPEVVISELVTAQDYSSDAIDRIKHVFTSVLSLSKGEDLEVTVHYVGAPNYMLKVRAPDYKIAEKILEEANSQISKGLNGADLKFEKQVSA